MKLNRQIAYIYSKHPCSTVAYAAFLRIIAYFDRLVYNDRSQNCDKCKISKNVIQYTYSYVTRVKHQLCNIKEDEGAML